MGKVAPPWLDRVQFILFYAFNPCDAELSLYVEMAKEPVGDLLVMLFVPDLGEIVENLFTPKGLRSKRHGRKGRKGGKGGKGFLPDVDEMIGDGVYGAEEFKGRKFGMGQRFFFTGVNAYERIAWPIVLIDSVTDTVFDTFMGVMRESTDSCPNIARMQRSNEFDIVLTLRDWHAPQLDKLDYLVGIISTGSASALVPEGTFTCVMAGTFANTTTSDFDVGMRIFTTGEAEFVSEEIWPRECPAGENVHIITSIRVKGPAIVAWQVRAENTGGLSNACPLVGTTVMLLQIDGGLL